MSEFERGARVTLKCAGRSFAGSVLLAASNGVSLAVQMDDGFRTSTRLFPDVVLLLKKGASYHELISDEAVELETIKQ